MKRTTIVAEEGLLLEVKQVAYEQGRSVSDVVQEALAEYVKSRRHAKRGKISFIGAGHSGQSDISEKAEDILESDTKRNGGWT